MDSKFLRAEDFGIRLEIVGGLPIWEPYPVYKHQKAVDRIRATIERVAVASEESDGKCDCLHVSDVYVNFPDGSLNLLRDKENPNTASSEVKQMRQRGYEHP